VSAELHTDESVDERTSDEAQFTAMAPPEASETEAVCALWIEISRQSNRQIFVLIPFITELPPLPQ
jgi:hypothetical protein